MQLRAAKPGLCGPIARSSSSRGATLVARTASQGPGASDAPRVLRAGGKATPGACGHQGCSHRPLSRSTPRVSSETVTVDAPEAQSVTEQYQWLKQWYPVATVDELDPTRPHQVTLFGEDYAVWCDGQGAWHVFADRCPHRLAPLSEGRVEKDGSLLCAYHAWRFDGSGACTVIPQAHKETGPEVKAASNPRACATAYPTRVEQGLIWMWPEAGALAELEAANTPMNIMPELLDEDPEGRIKLTAWRSHILPYGVDYFFENVTCPSHVVVSHHNIIGNRYTDPRPIDVEIVRPMSLKGGFTGRTENARTNITSFTNFYPPNLVRIEAVQPDGGKTILMLYAIPTTPGHCKHIGRQVFVKGSSGKIPGGISIFGWDLPLWFRHLMAPAFLHQDAVFLHWQERIAAQDPFRGKAANDKYFCPTTADKMVLLLRSWLEKYSPAGIPFKGEFEGVVPVAERERDKLFNTWDTHTRHCKVCLGALNNLKTARVLTWAACALAGVQVAVAMASGASAKAAALVAAGQGVDAAVTSASFSLPPTAALLWAVGALALAGVATLMSKLIKLFYTWPFAHADND